MKLRKAVFPVAGLGTRFLPATKAIPKELLPIVDKPLIQYATEEALRAGIDELIFVTSPVKDAIRVHFDGSPGLEDELMARGRHDLLPLVREMLPSRVRCEFVHQEQALGLGHAVLCAKDAVGNEPFAVLLPDDLIDDRARGCMVQMAERFKELKQSMIAVEPVPADQTNRYGIVSCEPMEQRLCRMTAIVEKPSPEAAPSNLAVVGRYVFTPALMEQLAETGPGAGGEIQLTDAVSGLLSREDVYAYRFEGRRFDCGSKLGFLQATLEYAHRDADIGIEFAEYVSGFCRRRGGADAG
jgi:UTP--glucose-1-phosphate uridylyltransferase